MPNIVDITGKKFGKLVVIEASDKRTNKGEVYWKCLCECGKYTYVPANNLKHKTSSCGCEKKVLARIRMNENKKNPAFIEKQLKACGVHDNTMQCRLNDTPPLNNTSGVRGISLNRKTNKFIAYINYKGRHYHIGSFDTLELAKEARKIAEKEIWGKDLE